MSAAAAWMIQKSAVTPVFGPVPEGVEVSRRVGPNKQVFAFVNYAQENRRVTLPRAMKLVLDGQQQTSIDLPPYGVAVALESR